MIMYTHCTRTVHALFKYNNLINNNNFKYLLIYLSICTRCTRSFLGFFISTSGRFQKVKFKTPVCTLYIVYKAVAL